MAGSREQFGSKLGFILAAAGSAVGIGNLVGFPVGETLSVPLRVCQVEILVGEWQAGSRLSHLL